MSWYARWQSRRREASRGRLKMPLDWGLILFYTILFLIVIGLFGLGAWVSAHCRSWAEDHTSRVKDKSHTQSVWYTQECVFSDDDGYCIVWQTERHKSHSYTIILEDGHRDSVGEGRYNAVQVGQNYTYQTQHAACDK